MPTDTPHWNFPADESNNYTATWQPDFELMNNEGPDEARQRSLANEEPDQKVGQDSLIDAIVSSGISDDRNGYCLGTSLLMMTAFHAGNQKSIGATLMDAIDNEGLREDADARQLLVAINDFQHWYTPNAPHHSDIIRTIHGDSVANSLGIFRLNVNDNALVRGDSRLELQNLLPVTLSHLLSDCLARMTLQQSMPKKVSLEFYCGVHPPSDRSRPEVARHTFHVSINFQKKKPLWVYNDANLIETQLETFEDGPYVTIPVGMEAELGMIIYDQILALYKNELLNGYSFYLTLQGIMIRLDNDNSDIFKLQALEQFSGAHVLDPSPYPPPIPMHSRSRPLQNGR